MSASRTLDRPWRVVLVLAAICVSLALLSLLTLGKLKDRAIELLLHGQPVLVTDLAAVLRASDAVAVMSAIAAIGTAIWMERRDRSFSRFLVTAPEVALVGGISLLLAWLGHAYFFSGVLLGGDTGTHIARFFEVRRGLEQGALPQWTSYQYLGSSLLGFTGPLTYIVGGGVDFLMQDAVATAKLLLFALHMLCGWLCYGLLRRLGLAPFGAAAGALGFAGSFGLLHLFLYRGVFPQAFTVCFFLAVFLTAEGLMRPGRMRWLDWSGFAIATGGLIINHQPHALFVAVYLALFGAMSVVTGRWQIKALPRILSAGLLGASISTVAVLPLVVESGWVMIAPGAAPFSIQIPTVHRLLDLVVWRNVRTTWGTDYWAYLGIVLIFLALAGIVDAVRERFATERSRLVLCVLPCLGLSFFLANPVVRDIMFLLFFVAILGAIGAEALRERFSAWPRAGLVIMLALVLDVSSTAIQPVARNDKQFLVDAGRYLELAAPNERIMEVGIDASGEIAANIGPNAGPLSYQSMVQRIAGHHNMAATRVHNYAETAVNLAEVDLRRDGRLSSQSAGLLALFNVSRIYCAGPIANGCPERFAAAVAEPPLGGVVRNSDATPVLFSRRLTTMPARQDLDKPMLWSEDFLSGQPRVAELAAYLHNYLAVAQPDWSMREALSLPVFVVPSGQPDSIGDAPWHPRLDAYAVSLDTVTAEVTVDARGFVQLSHPWFPGNVVRVNGAVVTPIESALHLDVVALLPGSSRIEIVASVTPIRVIAAGISAAALVATVLIAMIGAIKGRRRSGAVPRPNTAQQ